MHTVNKYSFSKNFVWIQFYQSKAINKNTYMHINCNKVNITIILNKYHKERIISTKCISYIIYNAFNQLSRNIWADIEKKVRTYEYISTTNYTVNQKNNNTEKETWNRYCKSNFICDDIISQFTRFKLVCSHYSFRDQDVDCCKFLLKCEEFNIRLKLREAVSWILKILFFFIGHYVNYMKLC